MQSVWKGVGRVERAGTVLLSYHPAEYKDRDSGIPLPIEKELFRVTAINARVFSLTEMPPFSLSLSFLPDNTPIYVFHSLISSIPINTAIASPTPAHSLPTYTENYTHRIS